MFSLKFGFPVENLHMLYGFPEPANEHMISLIEMYHNTVITLTFIFFAILYIVACVLYYFKADINIYPYGFTKWQESIIDFFVVILPLLIIYYLSAPAVGYILHVDRLTQYLNTSFNVEITGHQWYWSYYLDCIQNDYIFNILYILKYEYFFDKYLRLDLEDYIYNSDLYSIEFDQYMDLDAKIEKKYLDVNQVLVLPVNEIIKGIITSEDVIHSWALPQLGIKTDAIPGRIQVTMISSGRCGIFYGQCSELCGVNHAFMPICVEFVVDYQFMDWLFKNLEIRPYSILMEIVSDDDILMDAMVDEFILMNELQELYDSNPSPFIKLLKKNI